MLDFLWHMSYNDTTNKKRRCDLLIYNRIILNLNQQRSGRFWIEAVGQHIQVSIEGIGRLMYQEIWYFAIQIQETGS